jgi:hypothetical protein
LAARVVHAGAIGGAIVGIALTAVQRKHRDDDQQAERHRNGEFEQRVTACS